ncbi:MAG: SIMPL domain-containing protein [Candidatus Sulfotelmatobacter sp.]
MRRAVILILSLALLLTILPRPIVAQDCLPRPRIISVTGTAEVNVAPDEAVLSLGVESRDKDLSVAKAQHDARVKKLLAEARNAGVEEKNIQTSTLQMQPEYSEEKVPKFVAYEVSQTIQVTLKNLSKYENLITKLLESGVNRVDSVEFLVAEPRKYKDDARIKAIRVAREKATAMAAELGQTIGKPWDISEDTVNSVFAQTNSFVQGRNVQASSYSDSGPAAEESTVAPGQVSIRASVRVSFQLE